MAEASLCVTHPPGYPAGLADTQTTLSEGVFLRLRRSDLSPWQPLVVPPVGREEKVGGIQLLPISRSADKSIAKLVPRGPCETCVN